MSKFTIPDNKYMQRYKYKLYPTDMEKEFLDRCIDLYRYTYNWAIEEEYNQYDPQSI